MAGTIKILIFLLFSCFARHDMRFNHCGLLSSSNEVLYLVDPDAKRPHPTFAPASCSITLGIQDGLYFCCYLSLELHVYISSTNIIRRHAVANQLAIIAEAVANCEF
jgi:hypothetical protein